MDSLAAWSTGLLLKPFASGCRSSSTRFDFEATFRKPANTQAMDLSASRSRVATACSVRDPTSKTAGLTLAGLAIEPRGTAQAEQQCDFWGRLVRTVAQPGLKKHDVNISIEVPDKIADQIESQ